MVGHPKKDYRLRNFQVRSISFKEGTPRKTNIFTKTSGGDECILGPMVKLSFLMPIQVEIWNAPGGVFFAS